MRSLLNEALDLADGGWPVFPLNGKIPFKGTHGFKDATTDQGVIRAWWDQWPEANIGVPTGEPIGAWVLDVDIGKAGAETLARLEAEHGSLPPTFEVVTGSGGRHLYFALPADGGPGQTQCRRDLPGIDVRSNGGYVVVPPSIHPVTGETYKWLPWDPDSRPPQAPEWLLKALQRPPKTEAHPEPTCTHRPPRDPLRDRTRGERYAAKVLDTACEAIRNAPEGDGVNGRHPTILRQATVIGGYVASGWLDLESARAALNDAARDAKPGGDPRAVDAGLQHGQAEPLNPPEPEGPVYDAWEPWEPTTGSPCPEDLPPPHGSEEAPTAEAGPPRGEHRTGSGNGRRGTTRPYHLTELGNAERLIDVYGADLRRCPAYGGDGWMRWDGRRWEVDRASRVMLYARMIPEAFEDDARKLFDRAKALKASSDEDEQKEGERLESRAKAAIAWARKSESRAGQQNMITLAKADRRVVVSEGELDADPHLLNCLNGTIDLRTGKLREHRREDLITKLAPVEYDPTARAPRWQAFLSRTFADDLELVAFMQRVVGYVLAGGNPEHVFLIFYGLGANGKSVFVNAIRQMLGDYASTVATETFMQSRNANLSQSADLATLPGVRLVAMSETGEGRGLAEGLVKSVTGGEPVRCRHLYGAPFEYAPLFTPWLSTNHKPRIRGTDDGIWRRLVLVPFSVSIPKSEQDPELGAKLLNERAGIFAWAVEGYRRWREQGLNQPETVTDATREYRGEEDTVAQFVDECCERDPDARTENGALHTAYQSWCERNGFKPFSTQKFKPRLEGLGFEQKRGTQRFWVGLHLIPQVESDRRYA